MSLVRKLKVTDIAELLRQNIEDNNLAVDTPIMSIRKIAESYGCSPLTADRAVNLLVAEGILYRVKRKGTFVKRNTEKAKIKLGYLAQADNFRVMSQKENFEKVFTYCNENNIEIKLYPFCSLDKRKSFLQDIKSLDGLLISAAFVNEETWETIREVKIPKVLYGYDYYQYRAIDQVFLELSGTFEELFNKLNFNKYKKFYLLYEDHLNGEFRMNCFKKLLHRAGVDNKARIVSVDWSDSCSIINHRKAKELAPDINNALIVSTSDIVSNVFIDSWAESGLQPMEDYDLISCDNLEDCGFRPYTEPKLTSIDCRLDKRGIIAVNLLLQRIKEDNENFLYYGVPAHLKIRNTIKF
jgi:GntR family transcriptional regulator